VEKLFKVKVKSVRTVRLPGKLRRVGRFAGHKSDRRKAYVRLADGQKPVDYFEGR
jgi:large subunit ribosomal protein L23